MVSLSRRTFLGAALNGLISGRFLGADSPVAAGPQPADDAPFQPETLFLTWQRDPTTTMTVQRVGARGETADTSVSWATAKGPTWQSQPTTARPYPLTDLKVFRAELTSLAPGTDYRFRIGR